MKVIVEDVCGDPIVRFLSGAAKRVINESAFCPIWVDLFFEKAISGVVSGGFCCGVGVLFPMTTLFWSSIIIPFVLVPPKSMPT